jgi:hypothetical protein
MLCRPDFDEIIPRLKAWWQGEVHDRACMAVYAPSGRPRREILPPSSIAEQWTDPDYVFESREAELGSIYHAGEAIPVFRPGLGPDTFSALLGAELEFTADTSWARPVVQDWNSPPLFEIDRQSSAWQWYRQMYELAAERAPGRYLVAPPDCHSGGDCLLAMRGGTPLCMDLYDHPEAVRAAMGKLERAVVEFHETFFSLIERTGQQGHTCCNLKVWSPGRSQMMQLDLLALISPRQFEDFFYRELEVQTEVLDSAIFHLDGPDAIKHLPILYELMTQSRLKGDGERRFGLVGIQWVPGAGNYPMSKWIPLLRDIQKNGANIWVHCDADEVELMLSELSSRGLFITTGAESPEHADDLVRLAERLTHD